MEEHIRAKFRDLGLNIRGLQVQAIPELIAAHLRDAGGDRDRGEAGHTEYGGTYGAKRIGQRDRSQIRAAPEGAVGDTGHTFGNSDRGNVFSAVKRLIADGGDGAAAQRGRSDQRTGSAFVNGGNSGLAAGNRIRIDPLGFRRGCVGGKRGETR